MKFFLPSHHPETGVGVVKKMQLYYAAGAQEVWLCDEHRNMEFFIKEQLEPVPCTVICSDFPLCIEEDVSLSQSAVGLPHFKGEPQLVFMRLAPF